MDQLRLNFKSAIFKLCLNTKSSGIIVGQRLCEPIPFSSLPDMLFRLDYVMDGQNYPRAFQRKRSFERDNKKHENVAYAKSPAELTSLEVVDSYSGEVATLLLHVITRQNATWQGSVTVDGGTERYDFDSDLQLLEIIDGLS